MDYFDVYMYSVVLNAFAMFTTFFVTVKIYIGIGRRSPAEILQMEKTSKELPLSSRKKRLISLIFYLVLPFWGVIHAFFYWTVFFLSKGKYSDKILTASLYVKKYSPINIYK